MVYKLLFCKSSRDLEGILLQEQNYPIQHFLLLGIKQWIRECKNVHLQLTVNQKLARWMPERGRISLSSFKEQSKTLAIVCSVCSCPGHRGNKDFSAPPGSPELDSPNWPQRLTIQTSTYELVIPGSPPGQWRERSTSEVQWPISGSSFAMRSLLP